MNEQLRDDNTEENCTVESDDRPKTGRKHYWQWRGMGSNIRICTTCTREENVKEDKNEIHP